MRQQQMYTFRTALGLWQNDWKTKVLLSSDELMERANEEYMDLRRKGLWGKRTNDDQIVALTASESKRKANEGSKQSNSESHTTAPKWKYDRSLSKTSTYTRNEKQYLPLVHWPRTQRNSYVDTTQTRHLYERIEGVTQGQATKIGVE